MKLLKRIRALRSRLADIASGLALAERRVAHFKARAKNAENPEHPHPLVLERADRRLKYWRAKERTAYLRRHHLRVALVRLLKKLSRREPLVIRGKDGHFKVIGGNGEERLHRAFGWAMKHWHEYYNDKVATYLLTYVLDNLKLWGKRSDCSRTAIEVRRVCGLRTMDTEPRYTESALAFGREVDRHYAETHCGVWVIYGSPSFHMGTSTGHGSFTWEHGTPSLDIGHFDEFGPGTEVRYRAVD